VAFYRNVLGFILVKRPHTFNETFEGAWLWGYGIGLHLIAGQPVPRSTRIDPRSDHLSFQTDALQEVEEQLRLRGIPFLRQTVVEDGVEVQQIFCHDADNNMIEVHMPGCML
jgi:catechol 2,3-dioxygenase-like lactoylglutathione lyase family enzyme